MGVTVSAKGSSVKEKEEEGDKMSAQTKVEVTRGVFDPRTYKQVDKENWARKRKPEWMEERRAEADPARDEASQELKTDLQENPAPVPVKVELAPKKQPVQWVGRKRSDITREGGFMGYFGRTV